MIVSGNRLWGFLQNITMTNCKASRPEKKRQRETFQLILGDEHLPRTQNRQKTVQKENEKANFRTISQMNMDIKHLKNIVKSNKI